VLRAKQLEIELMRHLAGRVELADVTGQLIHALQRERGASSLYLASGGQRFMAERRLAMEQADAIELSLFALFSEQQAPARGASTRMLSLMATALLELDALAKFRARIGRGQASPDEAVTTFSRLIAGLMELIFQLADAPLQPEISRLLVAFFHLVQGKEAAGQERAVGAQLFGSGVCSEAGQQQIIDLIDGQERSLQVFEAFAEPALRQLWQQQQLAPQVARLERLRRTLCAAKPGATLDSLQSDSWFEVSSARISELWELQVRLVDCLRQACEQQLRNAEQDLLDSEGLLRQWLENPPPQPPAVERLFQSDELSLPAGTAAPRPALADWLQAQSERLASMEAELEAARRVMQERKVIERAKGALMSRLGLNEEAAYRALQKASMDHNRRLIDVAQATLSLPDLVFGAKPGSHQN
jgi:hypothetical protein